MKLMTFFCFGVHDNELGDKINWLEIDLTLFGLGGGANWPFTRFFLYNSETVQPIFTKICDFNRTYTGSFKSKSLSIGVSLLP